MFRCANCKQRLQLHVTRISYQSSAIHSDSINNNWNNWLAGTLNLFHFQYDWILTGQNDRQDENLTGQIHSQSGHCLLTGPYFEPCCWKHIAVNTVQTSKYVFYRYRYVVEMNLRERKGEEWIPQAQKIQRDSRRQKLFSEQQLSKKGNLGHTTTARQDKLQESVQKFDYRISFYLPQLCWKPWFPFSSLVDHWQKKNRTISKKYK